MVSVPLKAWVLLCDSSTGSFCPLVPLQLQHQLFNLRHDPILVFVPLGDLYLLNLIGMAFLVMWACGQDPVSGVNRVKFPLTFILQFQPFLCLPEDSLMFTLILWVLCPPVKDFLIF